MSDGAANLCVACMLHADVPACCQVHLHERFGNVFVDSSGGHVEAWLNPAAAVTLQVAAGGGVDLDPALKVGPGQEAEAEQHGCTVPSRWMVSSTAFTAGTVHVTHWQCHCFASLATGACICLSVL